MITGKLAGPRCSRESHLLSSLVVIVASLPLSRLARESFSSSLCWFIDRIRPSRTMFFFAFSDGEYPSSIKKIFAKKKLFFCSFSRFAQWREWVSWFFFVMTKTRARDYYGEWSSEFDISTECLSLRKGVNSYKCRKTWFSVVVASQQHQLWCEQKKISFLTHTRRRFRSIARQFVSVELVEMMFLLTIEPSHCGWNDFTQRVSRLALV